MGVHKRKRARGGYVYEIKFEFEGAPVTETVGRDERAANRLLSQRKRQIAAGAYARPGKCSASSSVFDFAAEWSEKRKGANKMTEAQLMRDHILPKVQGLRIKDVTPDVAVTLIEELTAASGTISLKTARNAYGVFRTMIKAAAKRFKLDDPCEDVPRDTWPTDKEMGERGRKAREAYPREDAVRLMTDEQLSPGLLVLDALWFFTAGRQGEVCGLTFRQWVRDSVPLGSLAIDWQYDRKPLKGERRGEEAKPRKVPVHPVLASILEWWWSEGFALTYLRSPTLDDFIVPKLAAGRWNKVRTLGSKSQCHTRSSSYKLFTRGCATIGVKNRTLHATRHTWITAARRGLAKATLMPALEQITHNAKGTVIDQYTHWEWEPLCEVVMGVSYVPAAPATQPVDGRTSPPAAPVCDGLNDDAGGGSSVGFRVASSGSHGIIEENSGGAGNRTSPTFHVLSREHANTRPEPTSEYPPNSRQFAHADASLNPQHGTIASAAQNYLVAGSGGAECSHLALQLAAAVMSAPVVQMAMAVLAGGPFVYSRAAELASLILAPAAPELGAHRLSGEGGK
jgi:integrase